MNSPLFARHRRAGSAYHSPLLSLLALSPASVWAATYYVATTATTSLPDARRSFRERPRAQTAAVAGDTVMSRGTYTTFTIAATDANYNYVHRLNKSGVNWAAYQARFPSSIFQRADQSARLRLSCHGFGPDDHRIRRHGVKDGTQKQSECFRIDGSAAFVDFYDCVAHDNAANGFYFTNHGRGSCNRCDSYNNIGTNGDSIGNTDGFGAHGDGTTSDIAGLEQQR